MSITPRRALLLAPILGLLATGFTECEYFDEVTVPSSDTTAPTTFDGVMSQGEFLDGAFTGDVFVYRIEGDDSVAAISAAMDPGGVKKITMQSSVRMKCCNVLDICGVLQPVQAPQTDQQAGGPGSKVWNGMWLFRTIGGAELPRCPAGMRLAEYRFSWSTEGEDFFGNKTRGKQQAIEWRRP